MLCIVLFSTPVDTYVSYALNRMLDTAVGVAMSLLINWLFPRHRLVEWMSGSVSWQAGLNRSERQQCSNTKAPRRDKLCGALSIRRTKSEFRPLPSGDSHSAV